MKQQEIENVSLDYDKVLKAKNAKEDNPKLHMNKKDLAEELGVHHQVLSNRQKKAPKILAEILTLSELSGLHPKEFINVTTKDDERKK